MKDRIGVFVPGICCAHEWVGDRQHQQCNKCGATCSRDERGTIATYSAGESKRIRIADY